MAVPPIIQEAYEAFLGIFKGTVGITFTAVFILFVLRYLFDIVVDWIFGGLKKYLEILFFPGTFLHKLWHSLAAKMLGYKLRVNFHMRSSDSFIRELKRW